MQMCHDQNPFAVMSGLTYLLRNVIKDNGDCNVGANY